MKKGKVQHRRFKNWELNQDGKKTFQLNVSMFKSTNNWKVFIMFHRLVSTADKNKWDFFVFKNIAACMFEQEFNYMARVWLAPRGSVFIVLLIFPRLLSCSVFLSGLSSLRGKSWTRHRTRKMCVHNRSLAYEQFIKLV